MPVAVFLRGAPDAFALASVSLGFRGFPEFEGLA
jgi:hypothetical protein